MTVGAAQEAPRPQEAAGFSDALSFAFADAGAELYGLARLGLSAAGASGLAILFHRGEPVAVRAEGGVEPRYPSSWAGISAAGVETDVVEPLRAWTVGFASDRAGFELEATAVGAIAELEPSHPVARLGGMTGYEQACRVRGAASIGHRRIEVEALGQRGHSWGAPDWDRLSLARTVAAWLGDDLAVSLTAVRPAEAADHEAEQLAATILEAGRDAGAARATAVADPRLSTTYDADGRQRAAGLELWVDGDGYPRRVAGEVLCGTSLDLGGLRLECAFFQWRMEGRHGIGRYDVLYRA